MSIRAISGPLRPDSCTSWAHVRSGGFRVVTRIELVFGPASFAGFLMNASELDLRARVVLSTQPRLLQILIAASPSAAMESLEEVMAIPGQGLAGDRYFTGLGTFSPNPQKPDFELTLIESEQVRDYVNRTGLNFTATDARRNLVTEGIDLNGLVGKEFTIGSVRIRGIRLCEPCNYLAKITHPEVLHGLVHRGGLRAAILSEGVIRCGDLIRV